MTGLGDSLPGRFAIFPLRGALLLPGGNLPLNIFEKRYLKMVRDAAETGSVIGMVQPRQENDAADRTQIFKTGCLGRISNLKETDDGRILINLTGVCRFDVKEELSVATPYRQVVADYSRWRHDLEQEKVPEHLRTRLDAVLRTYFARNNIQVDWEAIANAPLTGLVISLAMICPFTSNEKQAFLEAGRPGEIGDLLVTLMEMETMADAAFDRDVRH